MRVCGSASCLPAGRHAGTETETARLLPDFLRALRTLWGHRQLKSAVFGVCVVFEAISSGVKVSPAIGKVICSPSSTFASLLCYRLLIFSGAEFLESHLKERDFKKRSESLQSPVYRLVVLQAGPGHFYPWDLLGQGEEGPGWPCGYI